MPVPIIAAAAAAAAARLAAKKVAQAAGKQVVKATLGNKSAAKYAAQKAASNAKTVAASSRNAKKAAETRAALKSAKSKPPLAIPRSGVQTKPARKPVGNPPNMTKALEEQLSSASRGGVGRGTLGKAKTARKFTGSAGKGKMDVRKPARIPDEPASRTVRINSAKTTRVVRVNPKKVTSSSTSSVKRVTRKAVAEGGLETRGAKPTTRERINRARDLQWDKAERSYEASNEISMTGLKSTNQGRVAARGAGKKNMRKRDAIRTEANKNLPIQINSARPFKSTGADPLKANNARALKAANRTRAGKSAKKK